MVEFFIAFRHIIERKFQSIFSILGVAIAIMVFIVSLNVYNGLEKHMVTSMLTLTPHIMVRNNKTVEGKKETQIENYLELEEKIRSVKGVKAVIPQISTQTIVKHDGYAKGVLAYGIGAQNIKNDLILKIIDGNNEVDELNSILVGEEFAKELGINVGDEISLISAENKELKLIVRGKFKTGFLNYDANLVIVPITTMQILTERGEVATEIGVNVDNPQRLMNVLMNIQKEITDDYFALSWEESNQTLLSAVKFEKFVLIAILSLLLMIASFAVSVILNMIVREKIKDIGILKSLGYTNSNVRNIFMIEGMIIGVAGMILATILSPLVLMLFKKLFLIFMKNNFYYLEELPLHISALELVIIYGVSIVVVFLSTIYPALRAAKLNPVEALKYE